MIVLVPQSFTRWQHDYKRQAMKIMSRIVCGSLKKCIDYRNERKLKGKPTKCGSRLGEWANVEGKEWKAIASNYKDIITDMERDEWIEVNHHYSNFRDDKYPKSYRLQSHWWCEPLTLYDVPQRLTKKLFYRVVGRSGGELNAEYLAAEKLLDSFTLPEDRVDELDAACELSDWPDRQRYDVARFACNKWWSGVDEYGRYNTPLTNLSKAIRRFVQCDGESVVCLDYANFQPALLTRQRLVQIPEAEYERYYFLCSRGEIYEYMAQQCPRYDTRDKAKVDFCTMLNETNERMRLMEIFRAFAVSFPSFADAVLSIKEPDHLAMTRFLQHHETQLVFGGVVRELVAKTQIKFFTVHDAIFVPEIAANYVSDLMTKTITHTGIPSRVKVESRETHTPIPTTVTPTTTIPTNVGMKE